MVNFSNLKKLCTPACIYLVMSAIILILLAFQNLGNYTTFCIGDVECDVDNTWFIFFLKIVYVIFWTFILNLLCSIFSTHRGARKDIYDKKKDSS